MYGDEKYVELYSDYQNNKMPIRIIGDSPVKWENRTSGCYVLNSNGEKFYSTLNYDRNKNYNFENNLNQFDFYDTFEMNQYNATDTVTLVIDFKGTPIHIQLEKQ